MAQPNPNAFIARLAYAILADNPSLIDTNMNKIVSNYFHNTQDRIQALLCSIKNDHVDPQDYVRAFENNISFAQHVVYEFFVRTQAKDMSDVERFDEALRLIEQARVFDPVFEQDQSLYLDRLNRIQKPKIKSPDS